MLIILCRMEVTQLLQSFALNDVVTSEDKATIRVRDMLRSVAVLHTLDIISVGLPRTTG